MAFRSEELAVRLSAFANNVEDNGYRVLIVCTEISALNPAGCSGTHPDIEVDGNGLGRQENLLELRRVLTEVLAGVESQIVAPNP